MNLALIGLLTILIMLGLIMTKRLSTLLALIIVPILGYLLARGLDLITVEEATLGKLITNGLKNIAPTGVMFIFAILFFGILTDAGTFDPIIERTLKIVGKDPVKICLGTTILACLVHLDGSGAVTFLIVIPAMLPLYEKLGMRKTTLATCAALGAGTMNMLPWGGPTIRAITALNSTAADVFTPMLPALGAGIIFILLVSVFLGKREKARIGKSLENVDSVKEAANEKKDSESEAMKRPKLFPVNVILIIVAIVVLIKNILPPAAVFMIATALAMIINYPDQKQQRKLVDKHAPSALMMASMLFAAGSFTGIVKGSGMLDAMAHALVELIPVGLGTKIPVITGIFSMPLSLVFDPDSYYYGVLPVISTAVQAFGVDPVMVGRASIIGQMTTGFPISPLTGATFLLTGLAGIDLGEHQKSTIPFAFLNAIVMLIVAVIVGAIAI
ncbi:citrate:proton symporter [Peptoniphilus sp. GNH]|nr:citrate:proton symporter [Peptoniphilus sp. GNH]